MSIMANPYLFAALYRPKSPEVRDSEPVPKVEVAEIGAVMPKLQMTAPTTTPPSSLSVALRGKVASRATSYSEESMHPMRQELIKSEEAIDEEAIDDVIINDAFTGSNSISLGHDALVVVVPSVTGPITISLRLSPEQYLPPRGRYYDQPDLSAIFGEDFFYGKCSTCGNKRHNLAKGGLCRNQCALCHTRKHPDRSCSLLYCTLEWYREHGLKSHAATVRYRQIRPAEDEAVALCQMGLIADFRSSIVPDMSHPIVQDFYRNKPAPQTLHDKLNRRKIKPNIGYGFAITAVGPLQTPYVSGNRVNASLDPRLQGCSTSTSGPDISATRARAIVDSTSSYNVRAGIVSNGYGAGNKAEERLQELEEEALQLRKENLVMDREIRNLRADNEQLRGDNYKTGSKRPCL